MNRKQRLAGVAICMIIVLAIEIAFLLLIWALLEDEHIFMVLEVLIVLVFSGINVPLFNIFVYKFFKS